MLITTHILLPPSSSLHSSLLSSMSLSPLSLFFLLLPTSIYLHGDSLRVEKKEEEQNKKGMDKGRGG